MADGTRFVFTGMLVAASFAVTAVVREPAPAQNAATAAAAVTSTGAAAAAPSNATVPPFRPSPTPSSAPNRGRAAVDGRLGRPAQHHLLGAEQHYAQDRPATHRTDPELRIGQTGCVQSAGSWQTLPTDDFTVAVRGERRAGLPLGPQAGPYGAARTARLRPPVQPRHRRTGRQGRHLPRRRRDRHRCRRGPGRLRPDGMRAAPISGSTKNSSPITATFLCVAATGG